MSQSQPPTALEHFDASASIYEVHTGGCTRDLAEVAIRMINDVKPMDATSIILDNACGTGIVTDILVNFARQNRSEPEIYAADGAKNMTSIASQRFTYEKLHVTTAPGEALPYADQTFTHSITNLGLMFFSDAKKGAEEILRTLKPGGVAVVTGWIDLGYVEMIREVQQRINPEAEAFRVPLGDIWLGPEYTRKLLVEVGFEAVHLIEQPAHLGGRDAQAVVDLLRNGMAKPIFSKWSVDDQKLGEEYLLEAVQRDGEKYARHGVEDFGVKMLGSLYICRKT